MTKFVKRRVVSSKRTCITAEYEDEPGVFYYVGDGKQTVSGIPVSGPFRTTDKRFEILK